MTNKAAVISHNEGLFEMPFIIFFGWEHKQYRNLGSIPIVRQVLGRGRGNFL